VLEHVVFYGKRNTSRLNQASGRIMSHSEALSRLAVGGRRSDMIKRLVRRAIGKFERDWQCDASYMRDMIDASPRAARLFSRATGLLAAALFVGIGLAPAAAAQDSVPPDAVSAYSLTPRRTAASLAGAMALIAAVIGGRALAHAAGRIAPGNGRRGAIAALVLGPISIVSGGLVVVTAKGGLGTGNGLGGGVVAMIVGLIGMTLGGLALARSRRTS
jgi:hypothetical protein